MSPSPPAGGTLLSAADLNEAIRDLARRAPLDEGERRELARLWSVWQAAVTEEAAPTCR